MSNSRPFNVVRRRARIADILIPKVPTTAKYRLLAAPNFDGSFVQIIEAEIGCGYLDPQLIISGRHLSLNSYNNPNQLRVTFDPQSFAGTASIADNAVFWLKFQSVDFAGVAGTATNPVMILPEEKLRGDSAIQISGTAPSGADVSASLQLDLGLRMQDITIRNEEAATGLYVATEVGGNEVLVGGAGTTLSQYTLAFGAQGSLLVRGSGGTAKFSVSMTSFLPL